MSEEENLKSVNFRSYNKDDLDQELVKYKLTGKHVEDLQLNLVDCRCLREVLLTFPNTKQLELSISNYSGDIKREVAYPLLRKVSFDRVIPTDMKNFWKLFSNLTDVTIGHRDNLNMFTSEFINKVIQRNASSLRTLKLLDLAFVKSTFSTLRIPSQLKELEIIFFKDTSKQKVCRSEFFKQEAQRGSKKVFCTKEEDITSFEDLKEILKSQNELENLFLEGAVIDSDCLDSISRISSIKNLRLVRSELNFEQISDSATEFFSRIKELSVSHVSESSCSGFRKILGSLKDVGSLEINCIWPEVNLEPLDYRNLLPNLKELRMRVNHKSEEILKSFQLTENLEYLTANILEIKTVKEILKTSPNIIEIVLHNGENKVANFVARKFKSLEYFELITEELSIETVLFIVASSSNIKRVKIYSLTRLSKDVESKLEEKLDKHFPRFSFWSNDWFSFNNDLEVCNDEIDFKMEICYRSYRMDENFV